MCWHHIEQLPWTAPWLGLPIIMVPLEVAAQWCLTAEINGISHHNAFPLTFPLWAANPQKINSVNNTATEGGKKLKWLDAFCFLLLMEMWWEGIRVRGRLALQHDSVLFFPGCVVVDSGRACQWKMRGTREVGDDRVRGRRIDGGGGVLRRTPARIQFFCTAVDAADYGIWYFVFFFFFPRPLFCF